MTLGKLLSKILRFRQRCLGKIFRDGYPNMDKYPLLSEQMDIYSAENGVSFSTYTKVLKYAQKL